MCQACEEMALYYAYLEEIEEAKRKAVAKPKVVATKPTRRARTRPVRRPMVTFREHAPVPQPTRTPPIETGDASLAEAPALVVLADPEQPAVPPLVLAFPRC